MNRKFLVYGVATPDAEFTVLANNKECTSTGNELFSFLTSHTLHGKIDIDISVTRGCITIGKTIVRYPAYINNTSGYVHFEQPIRNPYIANNKELDNITISAGERLSYSHITFNGPDHWEVTMDIDAYPGIDLDIGNIVDPVSDFMQPIFFYEPLPNSAKNPKDLEQLKSRIFSKLI